jgi:hypothetical protein
MSLYVEGGAVLPQSTSIGDVTDMEISYLSGLTDNIQKQLNSIVDRIATLENK